MRVLHVVESHDGGVLSLIRTYSAHLANRGHDVHLLAPTDEGVAGARYHPWRVHRSRPHWYGSSVEQVASVARETAAEVVHLHSFFAGLFGRLAVRPGRGDTAVVYQPHSWAFDYGGRASIRRAAVGWERMAARRTDHFVANCSDELAEGTRHGVTRSGTAVGLPVDLDHFSPGTEEERTAAKAAYSRPGRHTALCVGRLCRQKGQDRLVAAWEHNPPPDTDLLLVGPGPTQALREVAPTQWGVSIFAEGPQGDVRGYLRAADVFVLASRYEGQSVAVAEALSCARPVVMCDVNGARDAVTQAPFPPAGAVVPQGDLAGLLQELSRRLTDDQLRHSEASAARQRAVAMCNPLMVLDRLEGAYTAAREHATGAWRKA